MDVETVILENNARPTRTLEAGLPLGISCHERVAFYPPNREKQQSILRYILIPRWPVLPRIGATVHRGEPEHQNAKAAGLVLLSQLISGLSLHSLNEVPYLGLYCG